MRRTAKSTSTALKHKHIATKWRKWAETGGFGEIWLFWGLFWDSRGVFVHERAAIAFAHHSGWKARPTQALYRTAQCPSHGRQYEISNRDPSAFWTKKKPQHKKGREKTPVRQNAGMSIMYIASSTRFEQRQFG
jgi:hypothetical protein